MPGGYLFSVCIEKESVLFVMRKNVYCDEIADAVYDCIIHPAWNEHCRIVILVSMEAEV